MIAFVTTCKGRTQHLRETLPQNLKDNPGPNSKFVILDYSSSDGLLEYLRDNHSRDIDRGKLVVYSYRTEGPFRMSHAKNMAARLGICEGADILVTLDADNFAGQYFEMFVEERLTERGVFLCPDFPRIKSLPHGPLRPQRGYAGRLAIRAQEFLKVGGYNETFDTWHGEDIDMIARLQRTGYTMRLIDNHFLNAIPHGADVRFKEYPHAQAFETQGEWKNIYGRTETVVNYGKVGCGVAYRNFDMMQPIRLDSIPTRVFGIGMHKTATTSLHFAFKILGYDSFHWDNNRKAWNIFNEMQQGRSMTLERSYSLCDNPIPLLYKELDAAYPGSKFILTIRNESEWLKSVEGLYDPKINPWYDWDRQPFSNRIHHALYGRTDFDAPTMLARYRRHNAEVKAYFKGRSDLLVMDMDFGWPMQGGGAGWPQLCGFLDKPIPQQEYPRAYTAY